MNNELYEYGVIECVDEPEVAFYRIALENEQNFNSIKTALLKSSYTNLLESDGYITESNMGDKIKKIFEAVKEAIKKFWAKIMGVFKRITNNIALYVNDNKKILKKYEKIHYRQIDKTIEGYNFANLISANKGTIYTNVAQLIEDYKPEYDGDSKIVAVNPREEIIERAKLALCNHDDWNRDSYVPIEDFDKELKITFFGSEDKQEIDLEFFGVIKTELSTAAETKKGVQAIYNSNKKSIDKILTEVKRQEKEYQKALSKEDRFKDRNVQEFISAVNAVLSLMGKALSVHISAIIAEMKQYRQMINVYVQYGTPENIEDDVDDDWFDDDDLF